MVMLMAQVFVALLRTCQPDGRRVLVRQALDTLTPALVRRLAPGDAKYPIWVRYTKKVLVEEGHSMPHLIHIWQLIVRHVDLFYSSR
jgi:transformation/transcription domain-associated protein